MQQRVPGCICELHHETGEPIVPKYDMCPVHKSEAPHPQKEAQRLVEAHYIQLPDHCREMSNAKKHALVTVEEVLGVLDAYGNHAYNKMLVPFYQQVKIEIIKYEQDSNHNY